VIYLVNWFSIIKTDVEFRHDPNRPRRYGVYNIADDKIEMNLTNFAILLDGVGEGDYDLSEEEAIEMMGDRISHEAIHAAQSKVGEIDEPNVEIEYDDYGFPTDKGMEMLVNNIRRKAFRLIFNEITARLPQTNNNNYGVAISEMWIDLGGHNLDNSSSTYHARGNDLYAKIYNNAINEMITKLIRR
jgi:hypothetical protein